LKRILNFISDDYKADKDYGSRLAQGLNLDVAEVERLANLSQEEQAEATVPGTYA
jgi:catalase